MEKDQSIALQKQVRDNADDLRREFLDMKHWEEQMKKADKELKSSDDTDEQGQLLPPVRKKKSSSRTKLKAKENGSKAKRIKSYDYSAWDHFDADKVCDELDKESESEDSGDEILSKEELEKKHEEATMHKVMGNVFVQEQMWNKAMACYNEAIKIFPYDAVFYANRALCHLKMDNLYSAEADCTAAIQRDEYYVKAYHRRATARMALKQYKEAVQDLKRLLSLEPTNKEAKRMLASASKYLENSNPIIISSNKIMEEETLAATDEIGNSSTISTIEKSEDTQNDNDTAKNEKTAVQRLVTPPDWLPAIEEDVEIVEPIKKLPHQRSKTPLKKIPVTSGDLTVLIMEKSNDLPLQRIEEAHEKIINKPPKNFDESEKGKSSITSNKEENVEEDEKHIEIPPVPKSSVQFLLTWRKYKIPKFRYKYLKQLPAESIPRLFQDSMETNTFGEILCTLRTQFLPCKENVFNYLKYLSEIKRFSTLTMFMGKKEKEDLKILFDFCRTHEGQSDDIIKKMIMKYEI